MDIKLVLLLICIGICCADRNRRPFPGQFIDSSEEDSREDWRSSVEDRRNILQGIIQSGRLPGYSSRWNIPGLRPDRRPYFDSGSGGGLLSLRPTSIIRQLELLRIVGGLIRQPLGQVSSLYRPVLNLPNQLLRPVFNRGGDEDVSDSSSESVGSDEGYEDGKDFPKSDETVGGGTPKGESDGAGDDVGATVG